MSQFCLNECTWIKAGLTNGRKQLAWDDVTKHLLFQKQQFFTTQLIHLSIGMLNI